MGSTIESAIVMSLVLTLLAYIIIMPELYLEDTLEISSNYSKEVEFHTDNLNPVSNRYINGIYSQDTCPEYLYTVFSGISDCYWMILEGL